MPSERSVSVPSTGSNGPMVEPAGDRVPNTVENEPSGPPPVQLSPLSSPTGSDATPASEAGSAGAAGGDWITWPSSPVLSPDVSHLAAGLASVGSSSVASALASVAQS